LHFDSLNLLNLHSGMNLHPSMTAFCIVHIATSNANVLSLCWLLRIPEQSDHDSWMIAITIPA